MTLQLHIPCNYLHILETISYVRPSKRPITINPNAKEKEENIKHTETVNKRKTAENKRKYKKIYDVFFARGGCAWYESLTGLSIDLDKIYSDIEYFYSILNLGTAIEGLDKSVNKDVLKRKLEKERVYYLFFELHYDRWEYHTAPETARQKIMPYACSGWADKEKMKKVYEERDAKTKETGIDHHVDHIVPILGKKVCGIHNEFNLQVIIKQENQKKSNKFKI